MIDDEPGILEVFSHLLRLRGYDVATAVSGEEGLRLARIWRPELVLLDVHLPDLSGVEVCRRIKSYADLPDVFVILLSGEAISASHKAGGLDTGADEYLTKPVDAEELLARIRTGTRLRDVAAALRASEQHYRRLVEILPDAVLLLDTEGRLKAANSQALAMLNHVGMEGLALRTAYDLTVPSERGRLRTDLATALHDGALRNREYSLVRNGGELFPVELSVAVSTAADGQPSGLVVVVRDITERKRVEEELRRLPQRIIEAQEAERSRVAGELHDGVNQIIASAKMRLRKVEQSVAAADPASTAVLNRCHELLVQALEENRRIAHDLRPSDLDGLGLADACRHFCEEFNQRTTLSVAWDISLPARRLAPAVELNLFRILQEALGNVERHAQASRAEVWLGVKDGRLELRVRDDGAGFGNPAGRASKGRRRGIGLTNMRERAASIGGTCAFNSAPGQGTTVTLVVPFDPH
jgi:PAS domain S-box-containing protein